MLNYLLGFCFFVLVLTGFMRVFFLLGPEGICCLWTFHVFSKCGFCKLDSRVFHGLHWSFVECFDGFIGL